MPPAITTGANFLLSDVPSDVEVLPVNLVAEDGVLSKGLFYRLKGSRPRTAVHVMHPRTDQTQNYSILPLVRRGVGVLGRAGRGVNNDVDCIHEVLLLDVAAGIKYLRDVQQCERIVLLGNSGGSSLAAFYQSQATKAPPGRLTTTPAGDELDLNQYDLPPADAIVILGGHLGEGDLLQKWIDPSVVNEGDALSVDTALDMYDPANGYRGPGETKYDDAFLDEYRAAQRSRISRLDALATQMVSDARDMSALRSMTDDGRLGRQLRRRSTAGWHIVVYRTCADPAMVDLSIDADDRRPGSYNRWDPELENYGTAGFARYLTPRAWLSTWSGQSTRVRTVPCLKEITQATLIVHYAGDAGTRLHEVDAMLAASASSDKQLVTVRTADHYGFRIESDGSSGERTAEGTDAVCEWILNRFPA